MAFCACCTGARHSLKRCDTEWIAAGALAIQSFAGCASAYSAPTKIAMMARTIDAAGQRARQTQSLQEPTSGENSSENSSASMIVLMISCAR